MEHGEHGWNFLRHQTSWNHWQTEKEENTLQESVDQMFSVVDFAEVLDLSFSYLLEYVVILK